MKTGTMTHEEQWLRFFELALESYRQSNPLDYRTDSIILFEMIETLNDHGIAGVNDIGQYTLPRIDNPEDLLRRMASHRN